NLEAGYVRLAAEVANGPVGRWQVVEMRGVESGQYQPTVEVLLALLQFVDYFHFGVLVFAEFGLRNSAGVTGRDFFLQRQRQCQMHAREQPHEQREAESTRAEQVKNRACDGKEQRCPENDFGPELAAVLDSTGDERLQPAKGNRRPIRAC